MKDLMKIERVMKCYKNHHPFNQIEFVNGMVCFHDGQTSAIVLNEYFEHKTNFSFSADGFKRIANTIDPPYEVAENDAGITLSNSSGRVTIPKDETAGMYAPLFVKNRVLQKIKITEKDRQKLLKAKTFVAQDELRPIMQSVLYGEGSVVASDAHKLVFFHSDTSVNPKLMKCLIPTKVIDLIKDRFDLVLEWLDCSGLNRRITTKGIEIYFKEPDGNFPHWQAVVPKDPKYTFTVSKDRLLSIIKELKGFSPTGYTEFNFKANSLEITAKNNDFDISATRTLPGKLNKKKGLIMAFKVELMIQCISALEEQVVTFELTDDTRAAVMNSQCLLMPMMVSN